MHAQPSPWPPPPLQQWLKNLPPAGTAVDIRYALSDGAPDSWYLNPITGEVISQTKTFFLFAFCFSTCAPIKLQWLSLPYAVWRNVAAGVTHARTLPHTHTHKHTHTYTHAAALRHFHAIRCRSNVYLWVGCLRHGWRGWGHVQPSIGARRSFGAGASSQDECAVRTKCTCSTHLIINRWFNLYVTQGCASLFFLKKKSIYADVRCNARTSVGTTMWSILSEITLVRKMIIL